MPTVVSVRNGSGGAVLLAVVIAISAVGCASTGTAKKIAPGDLPSLAGTWAGTITLPSGRTEQGVVTLAPSGDYTVRAGAFSAQGKAEVKDGGLALMATSTTGGGGAVTGPRSSVASLIERPDGTLVLSGSGDSSAGPFDYEVARRK